MKKYVFRKYDSKYRRFFSTEKGKIQKIVGSKPLIEHVGSTSIPKLGGKGILDILLAVPKNIISNTSKKLQKAGYEFRGVASTNSRLFFRRDYKTSNGSRRVHIHLTFTGSKDQKEMIAFRNYLTSHTNIAKEYEKIKINAVKFSKGKGELYKKHKEKFILDINDLLPRINSGVSSTGRA